LDHDDQLHANAIQELLNRDLIKKESISYDFFDCLKEHFYDDTVYDFFARIDAKLGKLLLQIMPAARFSKLESLFHPAEKKHLQSFNLFINIPFCRMQCGFCHYPNTIHSSLHPDIVDRYLEQLSKEIKRYYSLLNDAQRITFVAVGGGTPFSLDLKQLTQLCQAVEGKATSHSKVRTIESTPYEIAQPNARDKLSLLQTYGFDRVSLGVQVYDDTILKMIGCGGSSERFVDVAIERIRDSGFKHINIDLMCGLPEQNEELSFKRAQCLVEKYMPESITLYRFNYSKNAKIVKNNRCRFDPFVVFSALRNYDAFLKEMGYKKYGRHYVHKEKSSFSYEAPACDWLTYRGNWIGIGARAISVINNAVYQNTKNLNTYINIMEKNKSPISFMSTMNAHYIMKRFVAAQVLHADGIDKQVFKEQFHKDFNKVFYNARTELKKLDMCEETDTHFRIKDYYSIFDHEIAKIFVVLNK